MISQWGKKKIVIQNVFHTESEKIATALGLFKIALEGSDMALKQAAQLEQVEMEPVQN